MRTLSRLAAFLLFIPLVGCSWTAFSPMEVGQPSGPPQDTSKPIRISGGVLAGANLTRVLPKFPEEARARHINGTVVFHVIIGKDGKVKEITALSGPQILIPNYTDAVRQWIYRPIEINGVPVEVDTTITLNMQINGS